MLQNPSKAHERPWKITGEAPTPSPKIISVSGAKNEPKRSLFSLLVFVMTTFPFLIC